MALRSERRFINLNDVKSGMMIQFNYTKKSGERSSYNVLVIDPRRQNKYTSEFQLHGFVIDELSDSELIEFFSSFETKIKLDYEDRRASIVEDLNTDEAYAKFSKSKYVKNRSYRTFTITNMSSVRQILMGSVE